MNEINLLDNNIVNCLDNGLEKLQENFLQTSFGEMVDNGIDAGLRAIFPDLIENQVIDIKNNLFENGVKNAFETAVKSVIDTGKSAIGIFTGNFENISQIEQAVKKGGLIDTLDSVLNKAINFAKEKGVIDNTVSNILFTGKKTLLNNITSNIENTLTDQIKSIEKLEQYCNSWKEAYENQDISLMEKNYKKIEKQLESIVPLENTINKARTIENLQNLITNNGGDFNFSETELELAKMLV